MTWFIAIPALIVLCMLLGRRLRAEPLAQRDRRGARPAPRPTAAPRVKPDETRIVPAQPTNPGAELCVLALLGLSSLCALGFILVYAFATRCPR